MIFFPIFLSTISLTLANEAALQEFTNGNNRFASSIYTELLKVNNDNFLASPFSAESVLALTQSGAKDATAAEMRSALHLPQDQGKIEEAMKSLQKSLQSEERYSLHTANKIYVRENFLVKSGFKEVANGVFGADLENIDFGKGEEAAKTINGWVEEKTNDKIHNLVSAGSLTADTRVILVNALYFKGGWRVPFKKYATTKRDFYKSSQDVIQVDTMSEFADYNYSESSELNAKFLEVPFEGEGASLVIVLPDEKDGLDSLEKQMDKVLSPPSFKVEYVKLTLPKFKIETDIDFKDILEKLGMKKVFDISEADLSGIAGSKGDLAVDAVRQKTFIDVNEDGVEAAAATYVGIATFSAVVKNPPAKEFIVNHPFIFYIKINDLIVFVGKVKTPNQ